MVVRTVSIGCPLSPLLCALSTERQAIAIRADPNIIGLRRGLMVDKIGLHADDTILYLADQGPSLQAALEINWDKFKNSPHRGLPTPQNIPITTTTQSITN